MTSLRSFGCIAWMACLVVFGSQALSSAQTDTSTWQCLPEETVVAMRFPDGQAFLDAFRGTKFGEVMLAEKRKADLIAVCEKFGEGEWGKMLDSLKEYDLTFDEIFQLFAGETGYAVTFTEVSDDEAVVLGLGWMQPAGELATKFMEVVAKAIDEQDSEPDGAQPITRLELEVAGQSVMQLRFPSIETEYAEGFELPDDYDDLTEDEQVEAYERADEQYEASAVETITHRTVLICQVGDRLLIAHQFETSTEDEADASEQQVSDLMASLLTAHQAGGSDGFTPRVMDMPGVARTMSADGLPIFELLGDLRPIIQAVSKASGDASETWMRMFSLESLGPFALRQTADGPKWLTQFSLSAPAPRTGLMKLLDQEMLAIEPPQWVPSSAIRYFQISFDLQAAYETIKEEVTREFPDKAEASFTMAETQVQNFTQTSLPELLGSLGTRHTIMSFGVDSVNLELDDEKAGDTVERMAFVWQVADEEVWSRLLKVISPFISMAPGTEAAEEQGFSGYRFKNGDKEGGLMLGKGYLVVGVGNSVTESVLSALNNPPSGSNSLRGSEVFSQASNLLDLEPAMVAEITDNDRYIQMVFSKLNGQLNQFEALLSAANDDAEDDSSMFFFEVVRTLLPSDTELPGLMGVSAGRMEINDDGLFGQSVQEMPAK